MQGACVYNRDFCLNLKNSHLNPSAPEKTPGTGNTYDLIHFCPTSSEADSGYHSQILRI